MLLRIGKLCGGAFFLFINALQQASSLELVDGVIDSVEYWSEAYHRVPGDVSGFPGASVAENRSNAVKAL